MRGFKITKNITNREDASLDKYLQEIGKIELIDVFEEIELAKKIRAWDQQALEKLVEANLRFVVSVVKQYQNQWLSLSDLINEGNLGLIKAAERFDEQRGFKFISYAVWRIRQSIMYSIAEHSRIIRLPLNVVASANRINKAFWRFEQDYGYEPTNEQLAEVLNIKVKKINTISENRERIYSLDKPFDGEDPREWNLLDTIESKEFNETDSAIYLDSLRKEIMRVFDTLKPRERDVVKLYFWIDETHPLSLEEIGEKYDLTRERIRQIKERAIRKLKHHSRSKLLRQFLGK